MQVRIYRSWEEAKFAEQIYLVKLSCRDQVKYFTKGIALFQNPQKNFVTIE